MHFIGRGNLEVIGLSLSIRFVLSNRANKWGEKTRDFVSVSGRNAFYWNMVHIIYSEVCYGLSLSIKCLLIDGKRR